MRQNRNINKIHTRDPKLFSTTGQNLDLSTSLFIVTRLIAAYVWSEHLYTESFTK